MEFFKSQFQQIASAYSSRTHTNPFHNFFSSSPTTQDPLLISLGLNSSPSLSLILDPPLPPILQPLPSIFRALSVIVLLPVLLIALVDFAGYAVFRTLGVHRRRVRVKRNLAGTAAFQEPSASLHSRPSDGITPFPSSPGSTAPLLSPGSYDAQELLRHRARSASGASEADLDWTIGSARVKNINRARADAAAAAAAMNETPSSVVKHPDVGVEGALGLTDTDVEDSGVESGRSSPIHTFGRGDGRPKARKGLSSNFFGFTPMDSGNGKNGAQDSTTSRINHLASSSGPPSPASENNNHLDSHANTLSESLASLASNKSNNDSSVNSSSGTSSWVGVNQDDDSRDLAAASDLEPPHNPSLYRASS